MQCNAAGPFTTADYTAAISFTGCITPVLYCRAEAAPASEQSRAEQSSASVRPSVRRFDFGRGASDRREGRRSCRKVAKRRNEGTEGSGGGGGGGGGGGSDGCSISGLTKSLRLIERFTTLSAAAAAAPAGEESD